MAQPALAQRPRPTPDDIRIPGMTRVHCVGCSQVVLEFKAARVRLGAGSVKPALIVVKCHRRQCGHFNKFEVPEMTEIGSS